MNYLLDTNACIELMRPVENPVQSRFKRSVRKGAEFFVSSIVEFELWYGAFKSVRQQDNMRRLEAFFDGPIEVISFDRADAKSAGEIRARLETGGTPIGAYDFLIAGQALRYNMTLITANVGEFSRVKGLVWEDWGT